MSLLQYHTLPEHYPICKPRRAAASTCGAAATSTPLPLPSGRVLLAGPRVHQKHVVAELSLYDL